MTAPPPTPDPECVHGQPLLVGRLPRPVLVASTAAAAGGVRVAASMGLGHPTGAAAPEPAAGSAPGTAGPGTINIATALPAWLSPAAVLNIACTATEAKTQALAVASVPATGTASDALTITGTASGAGTGAVPGGPRSTWGAPAARAVYAAVIAGVRAHTPLVAW